MANPEHGQDSLVADRLQIILDQANERYGAGARFAYIKGSSAKVMTLGRAIPYCGEMIASEPDESLWPLLDSMHEKAVQIEDRIRRKMGERATEA